MTESKPKQIPPYGIRLPADLKARIQTSADQANRSLHAEIIHALEEKYPAPADLDLTLKEALDFLEAMPADARDEFMRRLPSRIDNLNPDFSDSAKSALLDIFRALNRGAIEVDRIKREHGVD